MYHRDIVSRKINFALEKKLIPHPPVWHSRAEIESTISHLSALWDAEQEKWVRPLAPDEIKFIKNERFLCKTDFSYFLLYCWIKSAEDIPVRFSMWPSQKILLDIIAENELEGISIELMVLKARQLGISRFISLLLTHRALFFSNLNMGMASSTPDKTGKLANMLEFTMDHIPHWLKPSMTADRHSAKQTAGIWREWDSGTTLTLQHGAMMTGIARGETPTINWLSEVSEAQNADEIDASLFPAVHQSPRVMTLLESTANGTEGWWHDTWYISKEGWPERRSRLRPVFLPYFVGGLYPTPAFLKRSPVPPNYRPPLHVLEHARACERYVQSDSLLTKYVGSNWTMPIEQQWFYDFTRHQYEAKDRIQLFFQEFCASDDEAFQATDRSIFGPELIGRYRSNCKLPLGVYGLVGPDHIMPYRLQPHISSIDPNGRRIPIHYEWGQDPVRFELVPLRWSGPNTDSGEDKIYIYEWPEPGEVYALGVDTAEGIGADNSVIEGLRKGNSWRPAAQVCEFATGKLNAIDLVPYVQALAAFYSVPFHDKNGIEEPFRKQCRLAIEIKGQGDQTQTKLQLNGWSNFHPWIRPAKREIDQSRYNDIGIATVEWFRDSIITLMNQMLRDNELDIRSPHFVYEMSKLVQKVRSSGFARIEGNPDDRFFALGFAVITLYQWERNRPVATAPPPRPSGTEERKFPTYPMTAQERIGGQDAIFSDERRLY